MGPEKLSDEEVGRRLRVASDLLGTEPGETVQGDTALEVVRQAIVIVGAGLEAVGESDA